MAVEDGRKNVFVTVGTTSFDGLVKASTSDELCKLLIEQGYHKLTVQVGHGKFQPKCSTSSSLKVEWYRYKDSLAQDMTSAHLIISHGGSGSIMEGLSLRKPLVVVVNDELMGNHQMELAKALDTDGHLVQTTPRGLYNTVKSLPGKQWTPYCSGEPDLLAHDLDTLMGFS